MKASLITLTVFCLTGCQSFNSNDPSSLGFTIPNGSTVTLNKKLDVEKGNTHVVIQNAKVILEKDKDLYSLSCRFEMKAFGPRTIEPDTFNIRRTEDGQEPASAPTILRYSTEIFLYSDHNSDVIKLDCSVWGDRIDGNFPVSEIQKTLGNYFSFTFSTTIN
jgi:hypothetical protein